MIKTLIVDDDIEMLQGLTNIIRWEDYGFTIAGTAESGLEALNMISSVLPDVVITDITMPVMDGLELIREAKKFKPDIKSIIISCHEDFSFAKEAIRLEADEYILKHTLTEEELIRIVNKLRAKLQAEQEKREYLHKAYRERNINKYVILEKFYTDIMSNHVADREEVRNRAAVSGILLPAGNFRLVSCFVDDMEEVLRQSPIPEEELFRLSILNIVEETVTAEEGINVFPYGRNAFAFLYWDNTPEVRIKQKILSLAGQIQENVQSVLKFRLSVCFSGVYGDIMDLKKAADEVEALRAAYFFEGPGHVITEGVKFAGKSASDLYMEFGPALKGFLSMRRHKELSGCIESLFERISAERYAPREIRTLLRRLFIDMEAAFSNYEINMEPFQIRGDTLGRYKKITARAMEYVFGKLGEARNIASRPEINKVVEYINSHINEEISCESMAGLVSMNTNYFSRLFKNEVGLSFSDYLVKRRMEVATELLGNSALSIEEIVEAVGIESISYFYRVYKKITGKTPGDIRNKARRSQPYGICNES
jgi:YesN/AraC family two-component response regulator